MKDLQKTLENEIVRTLQDPYGAGSDLYHCGEHNGEWLEVNGNLDVEHLASHVLAVLGLDQ